jgi:hypothetical protein
MASAGAKIFDQIMGSTTAHTLFGLLSAIFLPKISCLFVLQFLGVWELLSWLVPGAQTMPTEESFMTALPSAARLLIQDDCMICKEDCKAPVILPCGHIYCRECISQWFEQGNNSCPLDFRVLFKHRRDHLCDLCNRYDRQMRNMRKAHICYMANHLTLGLAWTMLTVFKITCVVGLWSPHHCIRLVMPTVISSLAQHLPRSVNLILGTVSITFMAHVMLICLQHVKTMYWVWRQGGPMWVLNELRPYARYSAEPSVSFFVLYFVLAAGLWTLEATLEDFASSCK